MGTVRKTITMTEETAADLERRHTALVAAGKARTISDTLHVILTNRDQEPPSRANFTVIDKASLAELKKEIIQETRLSSITVIRETLAAEITKGFKGFVAAMREDLNRK